METVMRPIKRCLRIRWGRRLTKFKPSWMTYWRQTASTYRSFLLRLRLRRMPRYFLGVDTGGTKSHALIADETGRAVGFAQGGTGNHESVGYDGLRKVLSSIT